MTPAQLLRNAETQGHASDQRVSRFLIYCSLHYSRCPVELRERWSYLTRDTGGLLRVRDAIAKHTRQREPEVIPLATCNRFDLVLCGAFRAADVVAALAALGPGIEPTEVASYLRISWDEEALLQVCRVASSLDSLVLGEPHILGQMKSAYQSAQEARICGSLAQAYFRRFFQAAKRVRSETSLGRNAVSVGQTAVELCRRVFERLDGCNALVLGAGEMGRVAAQYLDSLGVRTLAVASRSFANAQHLCRELGARPEAVELGWALDNLGDFDVIIAATSAPHHLVTASQHAQAFARKRNGRPTVLVDISVPRNADPALAKVGELFLFDIDDLDKVMEANRELRRSAAAEAERIIAEEVGHFLAEREQRLALASVGRFHSWVAQVVETELAKARRLGRDDEAHTPLVAQAVAKKLVSHPALLSRQGEIFPEGLSPGLALELLFRLSSQGVAEEEREEKFPTYSSGS